MHPVTRQTTLLAFMTTTCGACGSWWESMAAAPPGRDRGIGLVVVTPSRSTEDADGARRLTPPGAHLHMGTETWFAYGVGQAGTFVLVRHAPDQPPWQRTGEVLGAASPADARELESLLGRWLGRSTRRAPIEEG